jgi:hypothetical protein
VVIVTDSIKSCTDCKESKPLSAFRSRGGKMSHLYKSHCNTCLYKRHKDWANKNQDKIEEYRDKDPWTLAKRCGRYGITPDQLTERFNEQGGCCAICNTKVSLIDSAIDHNHKTGEFRGVLCKQCNRALGMFKDNAAVLRSAANYLEAFGSYADAT